MIWRNCGTKKLAHNFQIVVSDSCLAFILNHCFQGILKAIIHRFTFFFFLFAKRVECMLCILNSHHSVFLSKQMIMNMVKHAFQFTCVGLGF